jgi:hypothetical protein
MGTATQSEILDQKSKGRALGRLIKGIERMINDVFPDDVEFAFKYRNEEEDLERAQTAQAWATTLVTLGDILTPDEKRIIAANNIDAIKDAITDEQGNILRWDDVDPQTTEQATDTEDIIAGTPPPTPSDEETPDENFDAPVEKDYRRTAASFKRAFGDVITRLGKGQFTPGSANVLLLNELRKGGREAFLDGLKRAGLKSPKFDKDGEKELALWLTEQRPFLKSFVADVKGGKFTEKQLSSKGLQWANGSLTNMLYKGMEIGAPRKKWRWVINFLKENCVSCLGLNGQVHTMKAYANKGLLPQSVRLVCHGDFCGCKLVADDGPAKGRLGAVRFVRRSLSIFFDKVRMN